MEDVPLHISTIVHVNSASQIKSQCSFSKNKKIKKIIITIIININININITIYMNMNISFLFEPTKICFSSFKCQFYRLFLSPSFLTYKSISIYLWLAWWGRAPSRPQDPCSIFSHGINHVWSTLPRHNACWLCKLDFVISFDLTIRFRNRTYCRNH